MPKSLPYHPFLIESLRKNPELAAAYITATLEEEEPEPELLKRAMSHVIEALGEQQMTAEKAKIQLEKVDELLSDGGNDTIYNLGNWLKVLGLKLTVAIEKQEQELPTNDSSNSGITVEKIISKR